MKHEVHHHKIFITLGVALVLALGYFFGNKFNITLEFNTGLLLANALLLVIILHFVLDLYSGRRALQVIDVTPKIASIASVARRAPRAAPKRKVVKKAKKVTKKKVAKKSTKKKATTKKKPVAKRKATRRR